MMNCSTEETTSQSNQNQKKRRRDEISTPTEEENEKKRAREISPTEASTEGEANSNPQLTNSRRKEEGDEMSLPSSPIHLNILIVDDCVLQQKILSKLLKNIGYTADIAGDGLCALEMVRTKLYDCEFC